MTKDPKIYLDDIFTCIEQIEEYTDHVTSLEFDEDIKTKRRGHTPH